MKRLLAAAPKGAIAALTTGALALIVASCASGQAPVDAPVAVDHHLHLNSPAIAGFLPAYCSAVARMGGCNPALTESHTVEDLLAQMDAAQVRRGWLLSNGYLAQSPFMSPPAANGADILRSANDFTVAVTKAHPDRLIAFIAVDPRADIALAEISRCAEIRQSEASSCT